LPPGAVSESKRLLRAPQMVELLATMKKEGEVFGKRLLSPEAREAMSAFLEKRKPDFSKF
jgi:enoyl-CoA hydratase/carnithine racemase